MPECTVIKMTIHAIQESQNIISSLIFSTPQIFRGDIKFKISRNSFSNDTLAIGLNSHVSGHTAMYMYACALYITVNA